MFDRFKNSLPADKMKMPVSQTMICIVPQRLGLGGPASFLSRLTTGLAQRDVLTGHDPLDPAVNAVLVIGGTKKRGELGRAKRKGVRIVQRLNGMNWVHRKRFTGIRHFVRAETGNWLLASIRRNLADAVAYQSYFSQTWWNEARGEVHAKGTVIYNGIDLNAYTPDGPEKPPSDHYRVLVVEGHLGGGYDQGLESAAKLVKLLNRRMDKPVELAVAGDVPAALKRRVDSAGLEIHWLGVLKGEEIPALDRSAHMLFSTDINAACPNSVVEALACGLPVVSFDTGALREMVTPEAGCIAPYGGDPWKLDLPDIHALADCAQQILSNQSSYRAGARSRAEQVFSLDTMVAKYLDLLLAD